MMKKILASLCIGLMAWSVVAADLNMTMQLPVQNDNGSDLIDLASIRIYSSDTESNFVVGTESSNFVTQIDSVTNAPSGIVTQSTSVVVAGPLNDDVLWFRVTAVDDDGHESTLSDAVSIKIDETTPNQPIILNITVAHIESGDKLQVTQDFITWSDASELGFSTVGDSSVVVQYQTKSTEEKCFFVSCENDVTG